MSVWAETLPLAVAIAASPFPVIPAILLLFTARPRSTATAFLAGWSSGVAAAVTVFVLLTSVIETRDYPPTWVSWVRLVVGAVLVVLAVRTWSRRASGDSPAWMRSLEEATPGRAAQLALVLSVANPKVVLLAAGAGLAIGSAELPPGRSVAAVAAFTLVASATVALPLVLYLTVGERVLAPLARARDWLQTNNAVVMSVVIGVIGVVVLLEGVAGLR